MFYNIQASVVDFLSTQCGIEYSASLQLLQLLITVKNKLKYRHSQKFPETTMPTGR